MNCCSVSCFCNVMNNEWNYKIFIPIGNSTCLMRNNIAVLSEVILSKSGRGLTRQPLEELSELGWPAETEFIAPIVLYPHARTIPESLTETINGLKKSFGEAKKGIDESIAGIKPRKPLLTLNVSSKPLLVLTATVLLSVSIGLLVFINSPMYLAHQMYTLSTYGDIRNPGACYHDAYTKVKAGKRKEIKAQIRSSELLQKSYREAEAVLAPLIGSDIYITKIQYGQNADTLVDYRHFGNDVYWSAYFTADGSIWITDSEKIIFPLDAEKTLTSKKVKWEKVR